MAISRLTAANSSLSATPLEDEEQLGLAEAIEVVGLSGTIAQTEVLIEAELVNGTPIEARWTEVGVAEGPLVDGKWKLNGSKPLVETEILEVCGIDGVTEVIDAVEVLIGAGRINATPVGARWTEVGVAESPLVDCKLMPSGSMTLVVAKLLRIGGIGGGTEMVDVVAADD